MAVLYAQLETPPPRLTSRRDGLPPTVDDVLMRALAKTPAGRYASCGEFADALRVAFGLQRYDSDVAVALHQRSLADRQHKRGRDHPDTRPPSSASPGRWRPAGIMPEQSHQAAAHQAAV
jgi:hypothetical protein